MTKNKIILLVSIVSVILFAGCSMVDNKSVITDNQKTKNSSNHNDYIIGKGSLKTKDSLEWEESYGKQIGIFTKDFGDYEGYLIGLGKKPTGGYSIDINVSKENDKIFLIYKEEIPSKNNFVTQIITYNYNVVYIKKGKYKLEITEIKDGQKVQHNRISKS